MQHHNRQKSSTFPRDKEVRKIYTFTIPRESFDELNPDKQAIRQLISKHISMVDRLKKNMSYYEGKHKILDETKRERDILHMYMWTTQKRIRRFHTTVEHGTWASTTAVGCSVLSTTEIQ